MYSAACIIGDEALRDASCQDLLQLTKKRNTGQAVRDAGIIHGAAGTALLFKRMYTLTGLSAFDQAWRYWYDEIFTFDIHDNIMAGFKSYYNVGITPGSYIGFMSGIAGIGIVLQMLGNEGPDIIYDFLYL